MQFIKDKDFYKVARITGSAHNLLSIRLSKNQCFIKVTPLPIKNDKIKKLEGQEVLAQVLSGLKIANQGLKKEYFLSEIQFVPSDTQPVSVYRKLVQELIKRIDSNGDFVVT